MKLKFKEGKQKELLIKFRTKHNFSRIELAKFLNTKEHTLKKWIKEAYTLPKEIFDKLTLKDINFRKYSKDIIQKLPNILGEEKRELKE